MLKMKFIVGLCFLGLIAFSSAGPTDGKHMELFKIILTECKTLEGGSEKDIETLMIGEFPDTQEGHCMMSCVNEKIGIVSKTRKKLMKIDFPKCFRP